MNIEDTKQFILGQLKNWEKAKIEETPVIYFLTHFKSELEKNYIQQEYIDAAMCMQVKLSAFESDLKNHKKWLKQAAKAYANIVAKMVKKCEPLIGKKCTIHHIKNMHLTVE